MIRSGLMTQHGTLPASEKRTDPPPPGGERGVPDRVHTAMDRPKPAEDDAALYRFLAQSEITKLVMADHA